MSARACRTALVVAMIGVLVMLAGCGGLESAGERRSGFNQVARDATARLYAALDQMPGDLEIEEARQYWNDCGGVDDGRFFRVEVDFAPDDRVAEAFDQDLVSWGERQGWATRERSTTGVGWVLRDPHTGWSVGSRADEEFGVYQMGVSAGCYEAYDGHRSENITLPDDLTEFVRQRRPVEQLPVLDPDRGPIEVGTEGEVERPFDLSESESIPQPEGFSESVE